MIRSILVNLLLLAIFFAAWQWMSLSPWLMLIPVLYFLSDLVLGAIYIERNFYISSINHLPENKQKQICLTFDDGPHAEVTPRVLDVLKEKQVPAVFFVIGKNIAGNEALLRRLHAEGHQIGNHSFSHSATFDLKSAGAMLEEIRQTSALIESVIPVKVNLFRPPYGVTNPNLARAVKRSGMQSIGWNLRSLDTVAKSKDALLNKLLDQTHPGSIVLLHDRCEITADVLTDYIDECHRRGYTFVAL